MIILGTASYYVFHSLKDMVSKRIVKILIYVKDIIKIEIIGTYYIFENN